MKTRVVHIIVYVVCIMVMIVAMYQTNMYYVTRPVFEYWTNLSRLISPLTSVNTSVNQTSEGLQHVTYPTSKPPVSLTTVDIISPTPKTNLLNCKWVHPNNCLSYFVPRPTTVTPLDYTLLLDNPSNKLCKMNAVDMLVLVVSEHEHIQLREMIRNTWGNNTVTNKTIIVIFLFGTHSNKTFNMAVVNESKVQKDILMFDLKDSYYNLTLKVLLGLKWFNEFCLHAKYVLKVDDDTYLNLPGIFDRLESEDWNTKICGHYSKHESVIRKGKYRASKENYPLKYYPPHVKGRTYFMPGSIAARIANITEYIPYLNMEDVHVTGVLAMAVGNVKHKSVTSLEYQPYRPANIADVISGKTIISSVDNADMGFNFWKRIHEDGTL